MNIYHRKEPTQDSPISTIVKKNDDILDAVRYAYMMRRYFVAKGDIIAPKNQTYIPRPLKPMRR